MPVLALLIVAAFFLPIPNPQHVFAVFLLTVVALALVIYGTIRKNRWGIYLESVEKTRFQQKLAEIDWTQYKTAYGVANDVPKQLERLTSKDEEVAVAAAYELDTGLCHQWLDVESAALPALPFLIEALDSAGEKLTGAILYVLEGFATCANPVYQAEWNKALPNWPARPWVAKVHEALRDEVPRFLSFQNHPNEEIRDCARNILAILA